MEKTEWRNLNGNFQLLYCPVHRSAHGFCWRRARTFTREQKKRTKIRVYISIYILFGNRKAPLFFLFPFLSYFFLFLSFLSFLFFFCFPITFVAWRASANPLLLPLSSAASFHICARPECALNPQHRQKRPHSTRSRDFSAAFLRGEFLRGQRPSNREPKPVSSRIITRRNPRRINCEVSATRRKANHEQMKKNGEKK